MTLIRSSSNGTYIYGAKERGGNPIANPRPMPMKTKSENVGFTFKKKSNISLNLEILVIPVVFSEAAKEAIEKLDLLEMSFRVFGVMPNGHLAIEAFTRDKRSEEPFIGREMLTFEQEKVKLYIPKHHLKFIQGVEIAYRGWDEEDQEYYDEDRTYVHQGFECLQHKSDIEGLFFSRSEVNSIVSKVFWQHHHGAYFSFAMGAAAEYLDGLEKDEYTHMDIRTCISYGFSNLQ